MEWRCQIAPCWYSTPGTARSSRTPHVRTCYVCKVVCLVPRLASPFRRVLSRSNVRSNFLAVVFPFRRLRTLNSLKPKLFTLCGIGCTSGCLCNYLDLDLTLHLTSKPGLIQTKAHWRSRGPPNPPLFYV